MSFLLAVVQRLKERRRAPRFANPAMRAYYWNGATPVPHQLKDISSKGLYLFTTERWYPGTILHLTLECEDGGSAAPDASAIQTISVWSKVVRKGDDGVGLKFIFTKKSESDRTAELITSVRNRTSKAQHA